jgi:TonB family protein
MGMTQVWSNIIAYSVQIGLLVGLGAALPALLRLKVPRARLLYWQVLLLACLALPWIRPWREQVIAVSHVQEEAAQVITQVQSVAPVSSAMPPRAEIALWLLALGVFVRLVWLSVGLFKLAHYRRHGRSIPVPPGWSGAVGRTALLVSDEVSGPVTFGFLRPVVLLPASFPAMPEAMRDAILFHELTHVERRDWLLTLGEEIVRAVFWFHPAIWWVLGEIQLAREQTVDQVVVEMTQARDPYVDTLLAVAGVTPQPELAPAPLFLRRRHLKQRVASVIQEIRVSKPRLLIAQAAAIAAMAAACWAVTDAVPLAAQPQIVEDGAGVSVSPDGSHFLHRSAVLYPAQALARGIEGTVVVQVKLDKNGDVIDAAVLSGPNELYRGVQPSVLAWRFDKSAVSTTRLVSINFVRPPNVAVGRVPNVDGETGLQMLAANEQIRQQQFSPESSNATTRSVPTPQFRETRGKLFQPQARLVEVQRQLQAPGGSIERADTAGRSDTAAPLARFAQGASPPEQALNSGAAKMESIIEKDGTILSPVRIGGNVQAANLISQVRPAYPPLAKAARVQGSVKFEVTIGRDGTIRDIKVLSGPPLVIQAALEAVKQWTYKPTLLNGQAVEVLTTVDVNFTLEQTTSDSGDQNVKN